MTGPREWRHAEGCYAKFGYGDPCTCGLSPDPAPVGLTEDEALILDEARELAPPDPDYPIPWDRYLLSRLLAIIDRLSAAPVDNREREGEVLLHGERWRVTWRSPLLGGSIDARLVPVSPSVDPEEEP